MIKFFRHIRYDLTEKNLPAGQAGKKGKPVLPPPSPSGRAGRYFKYAIGEIVLVVIGILIALQINNWNENRKTKLSEVTKLNKLIEDLKLDSISFDSNLKVLSTINNLHQQLYHIGFKNSDKLLTENPNNIRRYEVFNPPSQKNLTLLISQINNETIRKELISYNDNLDLVSNEMKEFISIVKDKIRVYFGQKEAYNLSSQFEASEIEKVNMISKEDLVRISKNPDFQQILFEANYKLKSNIEWIDIDLMDKNSKLRSLIINELKNY